MNPTAANGFTALALSLALMLGAPLNVAKAGDPDATGAQSVKHKKAKANGASAGTTSSKPGNGAQSNGKQTHAYAKRGNCTGCETELPYAVPNATATHAPPKPRPAKTTLPKNWASPDNCKYVMPDDKNWEAEKTACNKAGYPTPWSDKEISRAPAPTPTPDDRSLGEKVRDAVDVRGHIQSEHDKAQGQPPDCTNSGTLQGNVNDILSGCQ